MVIQSKNVGTKQSEARDRSYILSIISTLRVSRVHYLTCDIMVEDSLPNFILTPEVGLLEKLARVHSPDCWMRKTELESLESFKELSNATPFKMS